MSKISHANDDISESLKLVFLAFDWFECAREIRHAGENPEEADRLEALGTSLLLKAAKEAA